jgi:hypothetical protein
VSFLISSSWRSIAVFWRSTFRGLGCGLVSAGILGATLVPWVAGRSQPFIGEDLIQTPPQQVRFYYTSWGTASLARTPSSETPSPDSGEPGSPWRWEEASLYHFTKPGPGTAIGDSPAGRKLAELYDSGLNLLAADTGAHLYASFAGGAYDISAGRRAPSDQVENAQLNFLPEPSPLALLVTGIACILLARGLRRPKQTH